MKKRIVSVILGLFLLGLLGCALNEGVFTDRHSGTAEVTPSELLTEPALPESTTETQTPVPGVTEANTNPLQTQIPSSEPLAATNSQLPNNKYGWGLMRNNKHLQPEMPVSISNMLSRYGAYWIGDPAEKVIYLTFDNGYENGYTTKILDALKANDVKAAFFVTGHYLEDQPELVKRMVNEGHLVCNHTDSHPSLPDVSDEQIIKELQTVEHEYEKITGKKEMKYLRPPKGEYSERTLAMTKELGYHNIFWSLALADWVPLPGGPEEAYRSVMDNLHNGAVILLHAVSKDDTEVMDRILKDAKAQGYTFKTLDDLVK